MLLLDKPIESLPRVGEKYAEKLEKLGIKTGRDLLFHFPFRYDDFSKIVPVSPEHVGQTVTIEGTVKKTKLARIFRRRMTITEVVIQPARNALACEVGGDNNNIPLKAVWFNQPYILDSLAEGVRARFSGKLEFKGRTFSMTGPAWERADRTATNTGRLVPIYPETKGLSSKWLRWQLQMILKSLRTSDVQETLPDPLPLEIKEKLNLPDLHTALRQIHFPENRAKLLRAQKRFAFEEMFLVQLKSLQVKLSWKQEKAAEIKFDEKLIKNFVATLPFKLTDAQRKASFEILKDLEKPRPMNRLLNGDVGSGKTIVAAIAALQTINAEHQVAIMAPTEVLARQHFLSFCALLKKYDIKIGLVTGSYREMNYESSIKNYAKGKKNKAHDSLFIIHNSDIIIGTHALIQEKVKFKNLALLIVDEQHRFGVAQRAYLQQNMLTNADLTQTSTEAPEDSTLLYEDITYRIRGAVFNVKKQLGLGHKENIYQKALEEELKETNLHFTKEKSINIKYDGKNIGTYRPDFIIENKIILELKSLPFTGKSEKKQIWHYLKESDYKLALLVNFGKNDVEINRIIYTKHSHNYLEALPKSVLSPHRSVSHKSASVPHLLSMTATPIPRTLALAFFGNLDLSVLDEMPKNRKKIITKIISPNHRQQAYDFIRQEIKNGRQVFVILPLVEESKILVEVKAAVAEHQRLSEEIFPDLKLGLLHGRLKPNEKEKVMMEFADKKLDILVSTSVVEVGIDIPNASVMIIEDADRFGLSQLHQFRGRVGRGEHQSYCFLFTSSSGETATNRLQALEKNSDGFAIAEADLKQRGPGEFFGTRQSGLPDIAMENLANVKLIQLSRLEARNILTQDPNLKNHPLLAHALRKFSAQIHLE